MKKFYYLFVISLICSFCNSDPDFSTDLKLWYEEPAEKWTEALPVGNGNLGAMIYGTVVQEHIQFNEETLWTGEPHDYTNKGSNKYLAEIRQLLKDGKQKEADKLALNNFMSIPLRQKAYQPFGDLFINFPEHNNYSNYKRELDLNNAICRISYNVEGVNYKREIFSSYPDKIIVIQLDADKSKHLNFNLNLDSPHELKKIITENNSQTLEVKVKEGVLKGVSRIKISTNGNIENRNNKIYVADASSAVIYLSAATNYVNYKDVSGNPEIISSDILRKVENKKFNKIKSDHIKDHQTLFQAFNINFEGENNSSVPTNKRIYEFWGNPNDPQFLSLYVQYARYLMIASSRPGTQPATLQGIWNDQLKPPWDSKWTTNINAEMNFWPAEITNLSECHESLFGMIEDCVETGEITAREHYDFDGWILHHNTDIWRGTAPINAANHGIWVSGGAWMCYHLWEHYLFTQDEEFLKQRAYPIMRKAALFFTQFLVKDEDTGWLVSGPSNSPENGGLVIGPTMDHQIIRALFNACIKSAEILDTDSEFADKLKTMIVQIAPNQIGQYGQLQEWLTDIDRKENHHRHVSHLWGVHPGNEINYEETPDLMDAAKQSLLYRGDEGTGWSLAWKINFWSRFLDGNHAYKLIHMLLSPAEEPERNIRGGSYPNLFDAHPPFQIDGNFGGAAGIVELLMQSHLNKIEILPALPDALPNGSVFGICARGGFELSFSWKNSILQEIEVLSKAGKECILVYKDLIINFKTEKGKKYKFGAQFETK
ncbi:glycoside hydrolase N-terminal domain-containing protein [Bacteroidota bacterium]